MKNFNLAVIEGRLVDDPEVRYTQEGTALCKFYVANNYSYYKNDKLQEEVNFIEVTTFSKLAEICGEYLKKGKRVIVNGRLKQSKWKDEEGINHSKLSITGRQVQFLDRSENGSGKDQEQEKEEIPF